MPCLRPDKSSSPVCTNWCCVHTQEGALGSACTVAGWRAIRTARGLQRGRRDRPRPQTETTWGTGDVAPLPAGKSSRPCQAASLVRATRAVPDADWAKQDTVHPSSNVHFAEGRKPYTLCSSSALFPGYTIASGRLERILVTITRTEQLASPRETPCPGLGMIHDLVGKKCVSIDARLHCARRRVSGNTHDVHATMTGSAPPAGFANSTPLWPIDKLPNAPACTYVPSVGDSARVPARCGLSNSSGQASLSRVAGLGCHQGSASPASLAIIERGGCLLVGRKMRGWAAKSGGRSTRATVEAQRDTAQVPGGGGANLRLPEVCRRLRAASTEAPGSPLHPIDGRQWARLSRRRLHVLRNGQSVLCRMSSVPTPGLKTRSGFPRVWQAEAHTDRL